MDPNLSKKDVWVFIGKLKGEKKKRREEKRSGSRKKHWKGDKRGSWRRKKLSY